jgi:methylated-DNA-protein-cysteine methyltransferase related protein
MPPIAEPGSDAWPPPIGLRPAGMHETFHCDKSLPYPSTRAGAGAGTVASRTLRAQSLERPCSSAERSTAEDNHPRAFAMTKSHAFARIHREVMQVVAAIPPGRIATFADIGAFLDVIPRQVAFLLSRQNDPVREATPWYRVVAEDGSLGRPKHDAWGRSQRELLEADGLAFDVSRKLIGFETMKFVPTTQNTGVTPTPRPFSTSPAKSSARGRRPS